MKHILLFVYLLLVSVVAHAETRASENAVTAVALEQDTCAFWNDCAHYIVAINADGTGSFIGLEIAQTKGSIPFALPKTSFPLIVQQLQKMEFFSLHDSYTSQSDGCQQLRTDQTLTTFYAIRGKEVKRIKIYWGCEMPELIGQFGALEKIIYQTINLKMMLGDAK